MICSQADQSDRMLSNCFHKAGINLMPERWLIPKKATSHMNIDEHIQKKY